MGGAPLESATAILCTQERESKVESGKKAFEMWKREKDGRISEAELKRRKDEAKAKMELEQKLQKKQEASLVGDSSVCVCACVRACVRVFTNYFHFNL